jgi:outer membrane protein assembly factor BamD (BamD/ComL family)
MLLSLSTETGTALNPLSASTRFRALLLPALIASALVVVIVVSASLPLAAADRGTIVREAIIYISPDSSSHKLAQAERGREIILLDKSRNWLQVEALLGYVNNPDAEFVDEDEEENRKTVTGWILDTGAVWASTPNGDRIVYGAAIDAEDVASQRHGRRGAAQDALRLYRRVYDIFPNSPLAAEALYRAADIKWQIDKSDLMSRPSAHEKESFYRQGIDDEQMRLVMKKFPGSKWAELASFHLIDNKLCGDWQGASKCPDKEADIYEKYAKEHPQSPSAPEALYDAAWRRAALIEIYKTEDQQKKSDKSKEQAISLAQQLISQYAQSPWASRGQMLLYLIQQGVPTYGNAVE